jgi:hypothetical protein
VSAPPSHPLSRRRFLVGGGAAAGVVLLGACGGDDSVSSDATPTSAAAGGLALVQFFGGAPMLTAGREVRAPFGVADDDALLPLERTPDVLQVTVLGPDGNPVGDPVDVPRHAQGLPRAYYPLRFTADDPGIYTGRAEVEGEAVEMAIKVDDAADVQVVQAGDALPPLITPTLDDAQGVDPVCTNDPVCPLHDLTVSEALDAGRPIALLVATPAFCQIAICGPVLDVLLAVAGDHPGVQLLHAEVYTQPDRDLDAKTAAVEALGLTFEPCLVLVDRDGRVVERLDTIYDEVEVSEALTRLT